MDLDANSSLIAAALGRISAGDPAALQTVYRLTSAKLFGICLRILGERSEAEDALQEIYVTVWRKAADFDASRGSPMTWLIAIARNRSIDRLRASRRSRNMDPIDAATKTADYVPGADSALEGMQEQARLHRCLDGLASHERAALTGAFFDGNTYDDLATRMNVPLGTMKSWIRRALIKLKACLEQMTDTFDNSSLPEDDLLAAEYALGVLGDAERAAAEHRVAREKAFARLVTEWERRLAPWAADVAEVVPSPQLWDRIVSTLSAQAQRGGLWQSLTFWRGLSFAAGALAAVCLAALVYLGALIQQHPLVAAIEGDGHRHFVATVDVNRGTVAVVPAAFSPDATRVPELWLIPADGKPRPVGLLHADQTVTLTLPPDLAVFAKNNAVLAVSLEPPGGSPTGQPTGPVIATGKLTSL